MALTAVTLSLTAKYFGVSLDRDTWLIALNCIVVIDTAIWGPVHETFRAKFVLLREREGEALILQRTRSLLVVIVLTCLCLIAVVLSFPGGIVRLLAPAYDSNQLQSLASMLLWLTPALLLNPLCQIGISILNAYESFFVPEISNFIASGINILSLIFLAPLIGIYALMFSYYMGLVLLLILLIYQIVKRGIPLFEQFRGVKLADFLPFLVYALPFFIPYFFVQMNFLVEKSLGNILGEGIVSVLDYSRKFVDIPINVLTSVMLTMLVPILSARYAKADEEGFILQFRQVYQLGFLIIALLIAFFVSSSREAIGVLLQYDGQITPATTRYISDISVYYAWSALVSFLYIIFGLSLLSSGKGRIYAFFGVIAQLIMIAANFIFYRQLGAYTFPITFIAAHAVAGLLLFAYFPVGKKWIYAVTLKYLCFLLLTIAVSYGATRLVKMVEIADLWVVVIHSFVIVAVFVSFLFVFRMEERLMIRGGWSKVRKLFDKQG